MVFVFDPTHIQMGGKPRYYHYELKDDSHYHLLGVRPDEKPHTSDDLVPYIEIKKNSDIDLLIHEGSKHEI